jgi:hypothetical protein
MGFAAAENPTTIAQLSAALIAWRPCCFAEGGAIVFVVIGDHGDNDPGRHQATYIRIPIDTSDTRTLASIDVTCRTTQKQGDIDALTVLSVDTGYQSVGFAAIVEKPKSGGGYDVCDARLELSTQASDTYDEYMTDEKKMEAAISYGGTQGSCVING